eukprot:1974766-Pleurochrysis_carterae.AAC.1
MQNGYTGRAYEPSKVWFWGCSGQSIKYDPAHFARRFLAVHIGVQPPFNRVNFFVLAASQVCDEFQALNQRRPAKLVKS